MSSSAVSSIRLPSGVDIHFYHTVHEPWFLVSEIAGAIGMRENEVIGGCIEHLTKDEQYYSVSHEGKLVYILTEEGLIALSMVFKVRNPVLISIKKYVMEAVRQLRMTGYANQQQILEKVREEYKQSLQQALLDKETVELQKRQLELQFTDYYEQVAQTGQTARDLFNENLILKRQLLIQTSSDKSDQEILMDLAKEKYMNKYYIYGNQISNRTRKDTISDFEIYLLDKEEYNKVKERFKDDEKITEEELSDYLNEERRARYDKARFKDTQEELDKFNQQ